MIGELLVLVGMVLSLSAGTPEDDVVDRAEYSRALNALRAQLASIRSVSGEYDTTYYRFPDDPESAKSSLRAHFLVDGDLASPISESRRRCTTLWAEGVTKYDALFDGTHQFRRSTGSDIIRTTDPSMPGIFPTMRALPFEVDRFPSTPHQVEVSVAACRIEDDVTYVGLQTPNGYLAYEVWFDRERGWPRRWVYHRPDGVNVATEIGGFFDFPVPGGMALSFPREILCTYTFPDGRSIRAHTLTVDPDTLRLNSPIDASLFVMTPAVGEKVFDEDALAYLDPLDFRPIVNEQGERIDHAPAMSQADDTPFAAWLLVIGGAAVVIAGLWIRRGHGA